MCRYLGRGAHRPPACLSSAAAALAFAGCQSPWRLGEVFQGEEDGAEAALTCWTRETACAAVSAAVGAW